MSEPSSTEEYTAISENALIEGTKIESDVFLKSDVGGGAPNLYYSAVEINNSVLREKKNY